MHPGKRPYRAVFAVPEDDFDDIGNPSDVLKELGHAWVSLRPVSGREYLTASGEHANVTHRVELARPAFEIPQSAVLTISGRVFEVDFVMDAPESRDIYLMCVEKLG